MKIVCFACHKEVALDHPIFEDYAGPVKCFMCGAVMDVDIAAGLLQRSSLRSNPLPAIDGHISGAGKRPETSMFGADSWR